MSNPEKFNFWNRRGWIRIWLVASISWAFGFVWWTFLYDPPWNAPTETIVYGHKLFGSVAAARAKQTASRRYKNTCMAGSVVAKILEDRGPPPSAAVSEESAKKWLENSPVSGRISSFDYWNGVTAKSNKQRALEIATDRIKQKDYHTHVIDINCVLKSRIQKRYQDLLFAVILPPLTIMAAVSSVILLFPWISKLSMWLSDGFRTESRAVGTDAELQSDVQKGGNLPFATVKVTPKSRSWTALSVAGAIIALCFVAIFANGLSSATGRFFADLRDGPSENLLTTKEAEIRQKLPISVSPDVMAVDVEIDQRGLRWTYQLKSAEVVVNQITVAAFMNDIIRNACKAHFIREMIEKKFYVKYDLIDIAGEPLASRQIDRCI